MIATVWPKSVSVIECEIDLNVGRIFANTIQGPDGTTMLRLVWANMLKPDFRPTHVPQPGFSFVCDLRFTSLPSGMSRYHARVMDADPADIAQHEVLSFEKS